MLLSQKTEAPVGAESPVADTTTQGFVKDVIEESRKRPVPVDFWAPWCGPGKPRGPKIEKLGRGGEGKDPLRGVVLQDRPGRVVRPGVGRTVEPGRYVRPAPGVPEQLHNIGIRIEDDAIVTATGCERISRDVPVTPQAIEALMRD